MSIDLAKVLTLPVDERIEIVQSIWDSVAAVPEAVQLTDAQRLEVNKRLQAYREDPRAGSPWPEVRDRITSKK